MSLLFIDLDGFKSCNDRYGHHTGDKLLRLVGGLIRANVRADGDEGFRYGGDEFAVLLPGAPVTIGARVGERIRSQLEDAENFDTTMSIGIAPYHKGMTASAFARAADKALYTAKSRGKNTIHIA